MLPAKKGYHRRSETMEMGMEEEGEQVQNPKQIKQTGCMTNRQANTASAGASII